MTKRIAAVLFVVAMLAMAVTAFAGSQDFVLINKTGGDIHQLYIGPSESDEWGENVLGEDVLTNGNKATITFPDSARSELWDVRVEDSQETALTWTGLKLNEISEVTLKIVDGKPVAEVK